MELSDVVKIKRVKGFLREGYLFYVSENGYYFIKKSVFEEVRNKLTTSVVYE